MDAQYHDQFWLVAGTAAPVIALAAVVALPDIAKLQTRELTRFFFVSTPFGSVSLMWLSFISCLGNVIVQAGLLALSLSTLATSQDLGPLWLPIVMAVAGILLLAGNLMFNVLAKRANDILAGIEAVRDLPGTSSSGPGPK